MEHLTSMPHYQKGTSAYCENCGQFLAEWQVPFEGVNEPVIVLCHKCQKVPNVKERIRAKRRTMYPNMTSV